MKFIKTEIIDKEWRVDGMVETGRRKVALKLDDIQHIEQQEFGCKVQIAFSGYCSYDLFISASFDDVWSAIHDTNTP